NGDGTATLSGTPNPGTAGSYSFTVTAGNGVGSNATQTFTLTVNPSSVLVLGFPQPVVTDLFGPHPNADANTAFVKGLYRAVLGRDAQASELPYWVNQLTANATRDQVALGVINSLEHRQQQVEAYYQSILGRTAANDPLSQSWVNLLVAT